MSTLIASALQEGRLRFGLPMWFMESWRGNLLARQQTGSTALNDYSQVFASVEGNTTFYGLPDTQRLENWCQQVSESFRFCFKVPGQISHSDDIAAAYVSHDASWQRFTRALGHQLGCVMLQLPGHFSPQRMTELVRLLELMRTSSDYPIAVELRHQGFFDKDKHEKTLLRLLHDLDVDRVIFDSRGLFQDNSDDPRVLDARRKKPRMPVHPIATSNTPVVRFIGHSDWQHNRVYLQQWQQKITVWLQQGKCPYVFIHTVGNHDVQHFVRFIESLWNIPKQDWPGECEAGQHQDLFG